MLYIEPLLGFLAFLWFLMASLLAFRRHRDWRGKAQILLGLCGLAFFGLILKRAISVTYPHIRADIRAAGDVVRWDITWRVCNSLAGGLPKYSGSDKEPRPATESKPHLKRPIGSLPE